MNKSRWNIWNIIYIASTILLGIIGLLILINAVIWVQNVGDYEATANFLGVLNSGMSWIAASALAVASLGGIGISHSRRNKQLLLSPEQQLIQEVEDIWIKGYLNLAVPKEKRFDIPLIPPPEGVVQGDNPPIKWVKTSDDVLYAYDAMSKADGGMLILGNPGAGKTIMMLQLAEKLIERAKRGEGRIPIILNLVSWAEEQKPLHVWIENEMLHTYSFPRIILRKWITHPNKFIYLLDGLDEVRSSNARAEDLYPEFVEFLEQKGYYKRKPDLLRARCVKAINSFRQTHRTIPIVVCTRIAENNELIEKLKLGAIQLEPLKLDKIRRYLQGNLLTGLSEIISKDEDYQKIAQEPFFLSMMIFAYQNWNYDALSRALLIENKARLSHLFDSYVDQRISQSREPVYPYTRQHLQWLAYQMQYHEQQIFSSSLLNEAWLISQEGSLAGWSKFRSSIASFLIFGLINGLALGLIGDLEIGLIVGLALGLAVGLVLALAVGLALGLGFSMEINRAVNLGNILSGVLASILAIGLVGSMVKALPATLPITLKIALVIVTLISISYSFNKAHIYFLQINLYRALQVNLAVPSYSSWQHWRWRQHYMAFLNHCSKMFLLRRVGSGYIFIHRTLQEHLARDYSPPN